MNFDRFRERIAVIVVVMMGLLFALYCGKLAGTGSFKSLWLILEVLAIAAIIMGLRDKVWVFIPIFWPLTGRIPISNIPFGLRDWAVLLTFASFVVLTMLKLFRDRPRFDLVDVFIGLSLLNLGTVFVRNPVGVDWLQSELVGGRPYFDIFIAFLAYVVISRSPINIGLVRRLPTLVVVGGILVGVAGVIVALYPPFGDFLGTFYSEFAPKTGVAAALEDDQIGRMFVLAFGGLALVLVLVSRYAPITLISPLHPFRILGILLGLAAILLSGFRSFLLAAFVFVVMSCYYRKLWRDLILLGGFTVLFLLVLILGNNRIFQLPLSAQRSLSFLPGSWDHAAASDARDSTEWRWQIWRMALFEDQWIQNKWFGDGFGFTKYQLNIMNSREGYIGGAAGQEAFLVSGNYHSGPISTIRYAGAVGLILLVPLMFLMVRRYHRLIKQSYGTPYFTIVLLIGMPIVYLPIPWVFVAGAYDGGMIDLIYAAGFAKLLERGLADYVQQRGEEMPLEQVTDADSPRSQRALSRPTPAFLT